MDDIASYLDGSALYGDDFNLEQIGEWYADEEEVYANLGAGNSAAYSYGYHAWNWHHAYRHLQTISYDNVLGFGNAFAWNMNYHPTNFLQRLRPTSSFLLLRKDKTRRTDP
jgi:hypothetical protein